MCIRDSFTSADVENPFRKLVSMIKSSIVETKNLVPRLKRSWADRSKRLCGTVEYLGIEVGNRTWRPIIRSYRSDGSFKRIPYELLECVVERSVSHILISGSAAFCVRLEFDRDWYTELRIVAEAVSYTHLDVYKRQR